MNEEVAIKVDGVSKDFLLPHEKNQSLKATFTNVFRGSSRSTERQHALKDLSFEVKKGEFFGIVGRNGSGKSTLLKILARIYQPTKGTIDIVGRLIPFIELGVGFNPELTGKENVYLSASLMGFSKKEVDVMYRDIVEFAELESFMDQKLKNYSSGMQVRLAFSIATRSHGDILLIDEVLAVGDADFQRKCYEYFKQLKKNKKTVVFVSHDMSAIREYCDSAILIEKSKLIKSGTSDEVAAEYSKLFLAKPATARDEQVGDRWGNGIITTSSIKVIVNQKSINIIQGVTSNEDLVNPVVGFRVRDASGKEVLGTNSQVENRKVGTFKAGVERVFTWEFSNILSDGDYTVDPAIMLPDKVTVGDWWDNAASFKVSKVRHLPYAIDPGYSLEVGKENDRS